MNRVSSIAHKYPTYRDDYFKFNQKWLAGKRVDDNAEGFWRIHNKLYNLSDFIAKHPGGVDWLEMTKGTDITELFETHHLTGSAEKIAEKYFIRDAVLPRNYKITFEDDEFYRTLKRRVANKVERGFVDTTKLIAKSKFYCDIMLILTIISFILVSRFCNILFMLIAAICLQMLTVISHNFIHQRDNWRMYLINFSMQSYREWRVFHAISHHMYPNSFHDLECSLMEPYLQWLPIEKHALQKYGSWLSSPFVYCSIYPATTFLRFIGSFILKYKLYWDDFLPFTIPLLMYACGSVGLIESFKLWYGIILISSFIHGFSAINAAHHHNKVFHDGDELKSLDFGIYQLSATFDRIELQQNHFITLVSFAQHTNHHLFPTLDHSLLPQLNNILIDTCKEFEADLITYPWYKLLIGQFKQLTRTKVNKLKGTSENDQSMQTQHLKMSLKSLKRFIYDVTFYMFGASAYLLTFYLIFKGIKLC